MKAMGEGIPGEGNSVSPETETENVEPILETAR